MELDGQLYTESDLIMQVLEEKFPEKPMMPAKGSPAYHRAQKLMRLERQLFGAWLQWLCRSWYRLTSSSCVTCILCLSTKQHQACTMSFTASVTSQGGTAAVLQAQAETQLATVYNYFCQYVITACSVDFCRPQCLHGMCQHTHTPSALIILHSMCQHTHTPSALIILHNTL